jgi:hypothetical protein
MAIFAKKHFLGKNFFYALLINLAIWLSGAFSFFSGLLRKCLYMIKKITTSTQQVSVLVWGSAPEFERVRDLYSTVSTGSLNFIRASDEEQVDETLKDKGIRELVFCTAELEYSSVFDCMEKYANRGLIFKMAPPIGQVIIGSHTVLKP